MQLPEGKLYPAVRRVRGPSSIKEISARYSTYVLSYTALKVEHCHSEQLSQRPNIDPSNIDEALGIGNLIN